MRATQHPANRLWGIYHADRHHSCELGDPLRTTIEAPTKIAAEEAAANLGFNDPWAHPIASEVVALARLVIKRHPRHQHELAAKPSRVIRI